MASPRGRRSRRALSGRSATPSTKKESPGPITGALQKILDTLYAPDANPELKANTALFITFDEGGGYYDSGFIQPLDFFGDGPRIPLVVVSPYSTGGRVVHSY